MERQRNILWVGMAIILILGFLLHRFSIWNWGIGVSHDSIFYISAAENFVSGKGISWIDVGNELKPLTHFPPLYPLNLSFLGYFIGVREAADWSASILFVINALLITLIIFQGSMSLWASLLGGLFALISPLLLNIHYEAMSEPLYIALSLTSFILLGSYLKNRNNWQLVLSAVVASLVYLTRYVGLSVLLTGLLSLVLLYPGTFREKFWRILLYGTIASVPNLIWYTRNYLLTGFFTNRVLTFHPITQDKFVEGLLSVSEWILPENAPVGLALGVVIFVVVIITFGFILKFTNATKVNNNGVVIHRDPILAIILTYIIIYIVFLLISLTFFDISTRLDNRILIPLYVMFLILSVISVQGILLTSGITLRKPLTLVSTMLFTLVVIAYVYRSWDLVKVMRQEGIGYNSVSWRNSEIVAILRKFDSDAIIYSNEAFPLYYLTGISAYGIPEKLDPVKAEIREDFEPLMEKMRERLSDPNSAIVVFHQGYLREGMPTLSEILEGFVLAHESHDGVIFVDPINIGLWEDGLSLE